MRYANLLLGMCCAVALSASPVLAADMTDHNSDTKLNTKMGVGNTTTGSTTTRNAASKVEQTEDGEWIRLNGTVSSVSDEEFTLDYGKDKITVETDDFPAGTSRALKKGDRVMVSGRIDDNFFTSKDIVASSVRIQSTGKTLAATNRTAMTGGRSGFPDNGKDASKHYEDGDWVSLTGKVSKMDGDDFTIQTGTRSLAVDASDVEDFERNRLRVGDRVSVSGEMDDAGLFDGREIEASSVVVLSRTPSS